MAANLTVEMKSLEPDMIFTRLDLTREGLESVRERVEANDHAGALAALLEYYRGQHPLDEAPAQVSDNTLRTADDITRHIFQWGPYEPADYGPEMRWEWDPREDIEWVAAVYRFYWAADLAQAYQATREDKYVAAFVELTTDWIEKHPLEDQGRVHYIYGWGNYPWLDIQTGIRASRICDAFKVLVHGESFTPEFLGILLASLHDHQVKTEIDPMGVIHNKAIFEQRGFAAIAETFPEFADARRWMELSLRITVDNLMAQTTEDGVQREWCGGYHLAVMRDGMEMIERARRFEIDLPPEFVERIRRMADYLFATVTPELSFPAFGDTKRPRPTSEDRSTWYLYPTLKHAAEFWNEPRYAALADLDRDGLPRRTSYGFRDAGLYVLRDDWGPGQIYFALHCPPPGISSHDQPDNGTFELYAFGEWLMNDTGFYTYGHDNEARNWHRLTRRHQTLTLDEKDAAIAGETLLWRLGDEQDVLVVQNQSYPGLLHRRTV